MASADLDTFPLFSDFPVELQIMVWEEAAANPPVLDIQRFTAEITVSQHHTNHRRKPLPVLCFTPHSDFINLTTGHRGLMGACQESRKAAQNLLDCTPLPIRYLTMDANGDLQIRQATVPFNPSGYFCISGLGRAMEGACKRGQGARGSKLPGKPSKCDLDAIQVPGDTLSAIKNLMVTLDQPLVRPRLGETWDGRVRGWDGDIFGRITSQMPNLETASLVGEATFDRRHHLDRFEFDRILQNQIVAKVPELDRRGSNHWQAVPWNLLWRKWKRQQVLFYATTRNEIEAIERDQIQHSDGSRTVEGAAMEARMTSLGLNLKAMMDGEIM